MVVDSNIGLGNLVSEEDILLKLNIQSCVALVAAATSSDFHILLMQLVFSELHRRFMNNQHLLVLQHRSVVVFNDGLDFVCNMGLWFVVVVLVVVHDRAWQVRWDHEFKRHSIVARHQLRSKGQAMSFNINESSEHSFFMCDRLSTRRSVMVSMSACFSSQEACFFFA